MASSYVLCLEQQIVPCYIFKSNTKKIEPKDNEKLVKSLDSITGGDKYRMSNSNEEGLEPEG